MHAWELIRELYSTPNPILAFSKEYSGIVSPEWVEERLSDLFEERVVVIKSREVLRRLASRVLPVSARLERLVGFRVGGLIIITFSP